MNEPINTQCSNEAELLKRGVRPACSSARPRCPWAARDRAQGGHTPHSMPVEGTSTPHRSGSLTGLATQQVGITDTLKEAQVRPGPPCTFLLTTRLQMRLCTWGFSEPTSVSPTQQRGPCRRHQGPWVGECPV